MLTVIFLGIEYDRPGDLFIYLQAAAELFLDKNIYSELYGKPAMLFYFGNPFLTTLLHPLTGIPMLVATAIWKTISIVCLLRIIFLVDTWLFKPNLNKTQNLWALVTLCLSSFYFIYSNLHLVQMTIVILFLSLESLNLTFKQNKQLLGGTFLALSIKFTPYRFYSIFNN